MNKTLFKDEKQEGEKNWRKRENLFMLPSDMKLKRKREIDL